MRITELRFLVLFLILFLINSKSPRAQEIILFSDRELWYADSLCNIKNTGCDWVTLNDGSMSGYAYHPNGQLWLILSKYVSDEQYLMQIYNVEFNNCQYSLLYSLVLPRNWTSSSLTANIDYLGRIYFCPIEYDTINLVTRKYLCRISNLESPTFENLLLFNNNTQFREVHFQGDKVYIPESRNPIIDVYDTNFVLVYTIPTLKHISGLTSFSKGCDSIETYSANLNISTQEVYSKGPDSICWISTYDLGSNTLSPICSFNMHLTSSATRLTSPLEFLSSDPECDLLIDLDRDNSTGVYPYDYNDSTSYCGTADIPIADQDLYIHTSAPLDSVRLTISTILDSGLEILAPNNLPPGFTFIMRNDSSYVLINQGASDSEYRDALLSLYYHHLTGPRTSGPRKIIIQGFNAVKDGKKITATVQLHALPYAGMDASLLLCRDTIIISLSALTLGQPGGIWQPILSSGGDQFNSTMDTGSHYAYILHDPVCGADTSIVTIARDTSSPPDILGPDQKLCPGDSLVLPPVAGASSILWEDGTTSALRTIHAPGEYWVSTLMSGGCIFSDSITITAGYAWPGEFVTIDPTCQMKNGEIMIDSSAFIGASQVIFNGNATNAPQKKNLGPGIYTVKVISDDHCVTQYEVELFDTPAIDVTMDSVITIPSGTWIQVPISYSNSIRPDHVHFIPAENILWSDATLRLFGAQDDTYEITFEDENGCTDTKTLHVHVEQLKGLYLPNVFHPGSNNENATWNTTIYPPYQLEVVRIYDRWGNMVHQSTEEINWDGDCKGNSCPSGVYVYQVIMRDMTSGENKTLKGDLTLIR